MSAAVFAPAFLISAFIAGVIGLNLLAKIETRVAGRVTLAPKLLLGLFAGVGYLFYLDDAMVGHRTDERVRELFHLSDDVDVVRHGRHGGASCYTQAMYARATVRFTPEQFARYVETIHDRSVWIPVTPLHYVAEKSSVRFSDDALVWRSLPEPQWMGSQQLVWNIGGAQVRRGWAQCYAFNRVDLAQGAGEATGQGIGGETADNGRVAYAVAACNARARPHTPAGGARVTAALDSDKQRLNVSLHFDSKPDYCNNRISRWLTTSLGAVSEAKVTDVEKR